MLNYDQKKDKNKSETLSIKCVLKTGGEKFFCHFPQRRCKSNGKIGLFLYFILCILIFQMKTKFTPLISSLKIDKF